MLNSEHVHTFIQRWSSVAASELATAQSFVADLCELLGVAKPHATAEQDYMFERPVTFSHGDGSTSAGRIDCYKRGHFVLEAKALKTGKQTKGYDDGLLRARTQGEGYARALPAAEGRPPFVLVVDVGRVIEVYAEFSQTGGTYTPFPDPRNHRVALADLAKPEVQERLYKIWTAPASLDPTRVSAQVTREVAALLAQLAKSLEGSYSAEVVASYLTRSLFSMFAEDVELLPKDAYKSILKKHRDKPETLQKTLRALWQDMDKGGFSGALQDDVLHFNGKLFKGADAEGYSLLLAPEQVDLLIQAAKANWREVEPAIFGTLLERALDPNERHALGAHYTPRAYVERLILPTVIEPLRADWSNAQAAALVLAHEAEQLEGKAREAKLAEARAQVQAFLHTLCNVRVLDPACGSGNFLYVTLEHLKRLEGEVLNLLEALGHRQDQLGFEGETVTLQQLLGIELNQRAAALAELVLWIGYLQWQLRSRGPQGVAEPVVHNYGNIECRDAVLEWDSREPALDAHGQPLSRWDGQTYKTHPVTGELVPDDTARVPQWRYVGARKAQWPQADFIVGNPPFIGKLRMREALGDGYVEALRNTWHAVPDSADFVMFWWQQAASAVTSGQTRRMGLITTNSLTMIYNRRVVQAVLDKGNHLLMAIPDHPWVDSANGAAVRIAMTVLAQGTGDGDLLHVCKEHSGDFGEVKVDLQGQRGLIHADLKIGANVTNAKPLQANAKLSSAGVIPHGTGMQLTAEEASSLEPDAPIKPYRNGKDLTDKSRDMLVIDCHSLSAEQVRTLYPKLYQWLLDHVKPERDVNKDKDLREKWWLHRRNNDEMRRALKGLPRYIATVMTAKHRVFQPLKADVLPDQTLVAIGLDDAFALGVLSSQSHIHWALATGSRLGVGNDPRYNKTRCFETFPFPDEDTGLTPTLRATISEKAEQIDAHRKQVLAAGHKGLTLTGIYNVLEALRAGRELTAKERTHHTQGLVGVLRELHDELDDAVLAAYGLPTDADTDAVLHRLVQLNAARAREEAQGHVRWLRPDFQNPAAQAQLLKTELPAQARQGLEAKNTHNFQHAAAVDGDGAAVAAPATKTAQQAWPATLPEQVRAVAEVLAASPVALSLAALAAHFKGRGPWKKSLPTLLQTLEALGRVHGSGEGDARTWQSWQM